METGALIFTLVFIFITIWDGSWKAIALWKSARRNQHTWFIFILLLNTIGILPITYLFFFQGKTKTLKMIIREKAALDSMSKKKRSK